MLKQLNISERFAKWVVGKAGNWQQYFSRGFMPDDSADSKLSSPFKQSAWVMRAIKSVSEPIGSVELKWSLNDTEFEDERLDEFWDSPVIGLDSFADFVDAWVGWLKLKGESFLIADDTWALSVPGTVPLGKLILARPDEMREVCRGVVLIGWEYRDAAGNAHPLLPEQVYQTKLWNPYNRWRGLGELEAALVAAEADYLAGKYEAQLARNAGDQGLVITTDGGQPTKEQVDQIEAQLRRKRQRLQRGDFTDLFLSAGLKVATPTVQGADAQLQASRVTKRHEIYVAFGVPPSLADVKQSYSLGKESDFRALIVNTCIPTANKLARVITKIGRIQSGQKLEAYCDFDDHPVMQEVRRERIDSLQKLWGMGMPLKDGSDYLDMDLPRISGDDVGYLPFSVAPLSTPPPAADPTFDETKPLDPVEEMVRVLRSSRRSALPGANDCGCGCDFSDAVLKSANPQWSKRMAARRATIKTFESRISRLLMDARKETLAKLEKANQKAAAADFMFDLAKFSENFFKGMRAISAEAVRNAGNAVWQELGKDDPWKAAPEDVLNFVERRQNKLSGVPEDMFNRIKTTIQNGFDEGWSTDKIANAIRAEFNGIDKGRAKTIAITETSAAYGFGEHESQRDAGITKRQWLSSGLPNVRLTHQNADGQVRGIDEPFNVGGVALMYPGDESGPPEETINCHCVAVAVQGDA